MALLSARRTNRKARPTARQMLPATRRFRTSSWLFAPETGGILGGPRRPRMGNFQFRPNRGRGAATGMYARVCIETKGLVPAPQVGLEPTTLRLTALRVVAASRCKHKTYTRKNPSLPEFGGTLGVPPVGPKGRDRKADPWRASH